MNLMKIFLSYFIKFYYISDYHIMIIYINLYYIIIIYIKHKISRIIKLDIKF